MIAKLLVLALTAVAVCQACDCIPPKVESKRDRSDVVFRGTILEVRDSSAASGIPPGFARDMKKTVVFKVMRVWKGKVGPTFEMPAIEEIGACTGFTSDALRVGQDLLVYASRDASGQYVTSICGFHELAKDATEDFRKLGRGREPR